MTETNWLTIGGTDVATIVGMNPWATRMDLYCRIKKLVPEIEQNEAMEWGLRLEDAIAKKYKDEKSQK